MSNTVRVRFAPSPTGALHIGGVRTALYNYLFAKKSGGKFILRIEDTDQNRFVDGAEQYIIDALKWCGIEPDEGVGYGGEKGPYRQSERKEMYAQYADQLVSSDNAYIAFDTNLGQLREEAEKSGSHFIYNHNTRENLDNSFTQSKENVEKRIAAGEDYVVRFKMPKEELILQDEIRGEIKIDTSLLDDKILFKSDGMPTYHLANIVDDHLMEISHVIRGEEWLPSMALHVLLYRSFNWDAPKFAHLPLILKPTGNGKLSKRDGDKLGFPVFPLSWKDPKSGDLSMGYKESGYLPEAVINMLLMLGWNPGTDQEIFTQNEMIASFSLERVIKAGARFSPDKTKWFNEHYLRKLEAKELAQLVEPFLNNLELSNDQLIKICGIMKDRSSLLPDLIKASYLWEVPSSYDEKTHRKKWKEGSAALLQELSTELGGLNDFSEELVNEKMQEFMAKKEIGFGQIGPVFRLVLTGMGGGPSLPAIASFLGKEEMQNRIQIGIEKLS